MSDEDQFEIPWEELDNGDQGVGEPIAGRLFADKFLLAIIDAYPDDDSNREQRLSDAKLALFGEKSREGPKSLDDTRALRWMASQHERDLVKLAQARATDGLEEPKVRSDRELARRAATLTTGNSEESIVDRLRRAFGNDRHGWLAVERHSDDVAETQEWHAIQAIKRILERNGVSCRTPSF